ncbi:hypothetical protein [Streptomyces spirodelae]|nr:hypothetical protein [Streptomyces spirodelae]
MSLTGSRRARRASRRRPYVRDRSRLGDFFARIWNTVTDLV